MRILKQVFLVAAVMVTAGVLTLAALVGVSLHRRNVAVREYQAQGFEMVEGCNGAAASQADLQVYAMKHQLEEFADSPGGDTNLIAQLQNALVLAQEKARVLGEDCRRRGHCGTHPWKTNWITIKQALTASEKLSQ